MHSFRTFGKRRYQSGRVYFSCAYIFLITGYFVNNKKTTLESTKNKFYSLIIPYMVTCLVIIGLATLSNIISQGGHGIRVVAWYWFKASLYGAGNHLDIMPGSIGAIGAIWFLLATFWASAGLRILLNVRREIRLPAVVLIFVLSWYSTKFVWLPFSVQPGGCALLFMYVGYIVKLYISKVLVIDKKIKILGTIIAFLVWFFFMKTFQGFYIVICELGRGIIDIIGSLYGCYCVLLLSRLIELFIPVLRDGLEFLGRYSLIILCVHIVELNVFPWHLLTDKLYANGMGYNAVLCCLVISKFIWIVPVTILLSKWNVSRRIFGYSVRE